MMNIDCSEKFFLSGTHTVNIVNGAEKYETIAESFADIFRDVNEIIDDGHMHASGARISRKIGNITMFAAPLNFQNSFIFVFLPY